MSNSKNHCSFVFSKTAKQKIFKRGYKDFIAGRRLAFDHRVLYFDDLINLLWNFWEKQKFNKTTNSQAKTYFPSQHLLNMILTGRANNVLGM